jgi:hypothetical protein
MCRARDTAPSLNIPEERSCQLCSSIDLGYIGVPAVDIETEKRSDLPLNQPPPPKKLHVALDKFHSPKLKVPVTDVLHDGEAVREMCPEETKSVL